MSNLPRTPATLALLEEALCKNHGDMPTACQSVGVSLRAVNAWINADPEAKQALHEAQLLGWSSLESAAYERAVNGVEKGVYFQGKLCGTETVYSDGLLAQMLKARVPGYGEASGPNSGVTLNVAIMPRADTYDEWIVQREKMLAPVKQPVTLEAEAPPSPSPPPKSAMLTREPQPPDSLVRTRSLVLGGGLPDVL